MFVHLRAENLRNERLLMPLKGKGFTHSLSDVI